MVMQLDESQVRLENDLSEPFSIGNYGKEGRVLIPALFPVMMIKQAMIDSQLLNGRLN